MSSVMTLFYDCTVIESTAFYVALLGEKGKSMTISNTALPCFPKNTQGGPVLLNKLSTSDHHDFRSTGLLSVCEPIRDCV